VIVRDQDTLATIRELSAWMKANAGSELRERWADQIMGLPPMQGNLTTGPVISTPHNVKPPPP
jgi:hypothetical protein